MIKKVKEMITIIEDDGWYMEGQRGSHRQFKHAEKTGKVTVQVNPAMICHTKQ